MKLKTVLLGATIAATLPLSATAADLTLRFGHVGAPGSLFEASVNAFAECANGKLGDAAEVQTFGASQLGNDREMLQKLKLGQVHMSLPSSVMSSVAPEFGIFEMPYIIRDRDHMKRVQGALGDTFQEAALGQGYRIIGYMENGFRHITNNVRPINTPEDLAGVKLRTPNGEWRVKMFQQYGANPTPMSFSEVFTALQTKVIDGQENPYTQIASAKFQEVQEYLSITGHVYTPAYVVVAENQWQKWPEDVRVALEACGSETQDTVYEIAANLETELLGVIRDAGVNVNEADKAAFVAASGPIYEEFAATVDGASDMIDTVQSLAEGS
ncbi:MAG: TRAP transporter substrate-binding protein [Pseudomonadota bacterium]